MDQEQDEAVRQAARLNARIHFADKETEWMNAELETILKALTGEQAELYSKIIAAQETHWQAPLTA
jgi:hypothetical protein